VSCSFDLPKKQKDFASGTKYILRSKKREEQDTHKIYSLNIDIKQDITIINLEVQIFKTAAK